MKRAIILMNVGTPNAPTPWGVTSFLFSFLTDKRVISIPAVFRYLLVMLVIIPLRVHKVVRMYRRLWKNGSSPILSISKELVKMLNEQSDNCRFYLAMSYSSPSLDSVLKQIKSDGLDNVELLPLYPQYADSTTGVAINAFEHKTRKYGLKTKVLYDKFCDTEVFKSLLAVQISKYDIQNYDHVLVLFHSLPLSQIDSRCNQNEEHDRSKCYKCQCEETFADIAQILDHHDNISCSMAYQSAMGKKWLQPFASEEIRGLAKEKQNLLVIAPSFYIDCLETLIEIDETYRQLFLQNGGKSFTFIPSPNASKESVEMILQTL
ncbi:MAG: ferrochelatase [Bacteroidales bacterium]